tara:strand:+ start:346 stop:606 length:261 start_codon:yes stop_codon:yes gene_type:complete
MNNEWQTKQQDMLIARDVIAQFGGDNHFIGIFEMGMDDEGNLKEVRLSEWVLVLTRHFRRRYGQKEGDFVMKKIISESFVDGHTLH